MFDTFQGLPLHALIIHATVVLVPLMAVLTVLVAVRPRLREKYAWWTFAGDVLATLLVWATMISGYDFKSDLGVGNNNPLINRHEQLGKQLIWFVLALAIAALLVALTTKRGAGLAMGATLLSAVAAVLVLIWVVRVGHAGAEAVWSGVIKKK
jgi:hypothetical protein